MTVVDQWTGRRARALQEAMRLTNEAFADHLGVSARTVAKWRERPDVVPTAQLQETLDAALGMAPEEVKARFAERRSDQLSVYLDGTVLHQLQSVIGELTQVLARISPADPRISPQDQRISAAEQRTSPTDQRTSPADQRSSPADQRISPADARVSPADPRGER
jgi:transcriptional regulator with XRE-family HTH domain